MEEVYSKLYDKILHSPKIYLVSRYPLTCKGGNKQEYWYQCDNSIYYYLKMNHFRDEDVDKGMFLVLIDYLTCIPYGDKGYKIMAKLLKNEKVSEYRYNKLKEILKDELEDLPTSYKEEIKDFFANYPNASFALNKVSDIVNCICRIYHNCEALYLESGDNSVDLADSLVDYLVDNSDKESMEVKEILKLIPKRKELGKQEIDFIKETSELNKNKR